ncbi:MAG: 2Fe-2S iron-sulfur cluster-binding protein, partial [Planctomycetota bacterium]|nr:2Fe-2S iron-sulfur cluster-binding protein [Planctomycetota bacterium]
MDYNTIGLGVLMFSIVVMAMIALLLWAKGKLVQSGPVTITVNEDNDKAMSCLAGNTLLTTLSEQKLFIPSACGGGGTCGQCRVQVHDGGGDLLPTEEGHISRGDAKESWRLACQVKVKEDMAIEVEPEIFSVKKWECEVISNNNVATFIKEFVVQLPEGE